MDYLSHLNGGADVIALRVEKVHAAKFADPKWARLMEMKQRDSHTQRKKSRSERNRPIQRIYKTHMSLEIRTEAHARKMKVISFALLLWEISVQVMWRSPPDRFSGYQSHLWMPCVHV